MVGVSHNYSTIKFLFRNYEFGTNEEPGSSAIGFGGFLRYAIMLVFVNQLIIFYLEVLSTSHFFYTLSKVILSTILSVVIIMIAVLITSKRKKNI